MTENQFTEKKLLRRFFGHTHLSMISMQENLFISRATLYGAVTAFFFISWNAFAQVQQAWVARYNNGITNGTNQAVKMALDSAGNIYIAGISQNTNNQLGYVTIRYAPNGNQLWTARFDSTNYPTAAPAALAIDNSNNAVVTGNALTIKYDNSGSELWTAPYSGVALAVDTNGNVVTTGMGAIFGTIKLNTTGATLWQQSYPSACATVAGQAVVVDSSNNIYVAGSYPFFCNDGLVDYEYFVIKYDTNGTQLWTTSYEDGGKQWQTDGLLLDTANNLYVAGNFIGGSGSKYVGFAYEPNGNLLWSAFAANNLASMDFGAAVDGTKCLIITGKIPRSGFISVGG